MRYTVILTCLTAAWLAGACSSQQAYDIGQTWQRHECSNIADMQERQRCIHSASTPYDTYQRQRQEIQQ